MKLLITGGAGFIGSSVIRQALSKSENIVINIDKLTYAANLASIDGLSESENLVFENTDICNRGELDRIFAEYKPDAVMHLAAETHVDRSIANPEDFVQSNIIGTFTLLEAARYYWEKLSSEKKAKFRFHHISTDEVFGDLDSMDTLFTEETPYDPSSPYSASKAASDHLVRAWMRTYGIPILITNCSNNYGPWQFPEKLIPLITLNALNGMDLPIYGRGDQIRDWLYVDDHAVALLKVLVNGVPGETYNIGGNNEIKNIDVVSSICEILDELVPIKGSYKDQIKFVADRAGHDKRYAIDNRKIKEKLGWEPSESFQSGLRKTIEWYIDNR